MFAERYIIEEKFADAPIMSAIAWCESKFRQFDDDGTIHRGVNPSDVGVLQINEYYHSKTAVRFGIDLHTLEGNVAYARYLFEKEGTRPWASSSHCWEKGGESDHLAFR